MSVLVMCNVVESISGAHCTNLNGASPVTETEAVLLPIDQPSMVAVLKPRDEKHGVFRH